jgi:LPS export ABC transporter protein LptC
MGAELNAMISPSMAHLRRIALWTIPVVLVLAVIWSALPHGGVEQAAPPAPPPAMPNNGAAQPAAPAPSPSSAAAPSGAGATPSAAGRDAPAAPGAPTPAQTPQRPSAGVASGEIKLGNLVGTDEHGHTRWQILADDMVLRSQQTVALTNVRATFFDNDGSHMLVNGDHGTYNTRSREITVTGNVHGVTSTGRELFADTVYYSPASRRVQGTGHVKVVQERVIMYADRMVSDLTLGQTRFFGNVHMTLR